MSHPGRTPEDSRPKRWIVVVGILVVAALLGLMIFLHLSGAIGPGLH